MTRRFPAIPACIILIAPGVAAALHAGGAAAQEGTVAYTHSVRLDLDLPPQIRARMEEARRARPDAPPPPTTRTDEVVLLFDGTHSLMRTVPAARRQGDRPPPPPGGDQRAARMRGFMERMRRRSASRRNRETIVGAYVDFAADSIVEVREFLGRTFLIPDARPALRWKITGEQARFLDYTVVKATAVQDSATVEAWFTPEIPIPAGPGPYGGLPGMILVLTVDEGREQYSATQVSLSTVEEGVIERPEDGQVVSRDEYEKIVAEKLEELRRVGGGEES